MVTEDEGSIGYPFFRFRPLDHIKVADYPTDIVSAVTNEKVRIELVNLLCDYLGRIRYHFAGDEDFMPAWRPPHVEQVLPETGAEWQGLPTGLAVSGLLLNCALHSTDKTIAVSLSDSINERSFAFGRFADDMFVLASTPEDLLFRVEQVWGAVSGEPGLPLAKRPKEHLDSNLRFNFKKIEPSPVREVIEEYLGENGWDSRCEGCNQRLPSLTPSANTSSISGWIPQKLPAHREAFERSAITADNMQGFVTFLVERLSEIGNGGVIDRFGVNASDRLTELHELVRLKIDDSQVRMDTRLSFAAHRLARAWVPETDEELISFHQDAIRRSIREAVMQAPWKFSLWKTVVRAACRVSSSQEEELLRSERWLRDLLHQISDDKAHDGWLHRWPEADLISERCRETDQARGTYSIPTNAADWRSLYLSNLRANFWRALAETIKDLRRLTDNLRGEASDFEWSSESWTFRVFLSEETVELCLKMLCNLSKWADALYSGVPELRWWESEALAQAVLAASDPLIFANCIESQTSVDISVRESRQIRPFFDLSPIARVFEPYSKISKMLFRQDKTLNNPTGRTFHFIPLLGSIEQIRPRIAKWLEKHLIRDYRLFGVATSMGVTDELSRETVAARPWKTGILESEPPVGDVNPALFRMKWLADYYHWRRAFLKQMPEVHSQGSVPTVHRLLWSYASREGIEGWKLEPTQVPAVGLPVRVAAAMLRDILAEAKMSESSFPHTWVVPEAVRSRLSRGRLCQFEISDLDLNLDDVRIAGPLAICADNPDAWEVPPHPVHFLRKALAGETIRSIETRIADAVLLFFTALSGNENFLDILYKNGIGATPLEERWDLRARLNLDAEVWSVFDSILRWLLGKLPTVEFSGLTLSAVKELSPPEVSIFDFLWQKVDITLDLDHSRELSVEVKPLSYQPRAKVFDDWLFPDQTLFEELDVRIGQVCAKPSWNTFVTRKVPRRLSRGEMQKVMVQVHEALNATNFENSRERLTVLPEVCLPKTEVKAILDYVRKTRNSVFAGLIWQEVRAPILSRRPKYTSYLVNEAIFVTPLRRRLGTTKGRPLVRHFFVRKPLPTHVEHGLTEALTTEYDKRGRKRSFRMLAGTTWYRFIHDEWGNFTVAICSDLLDPSPWASMRGEIQHVFMTAYNTDVGLYEALTWVRAYENYVNVVATNHGDAGGSFAWTPRHSDEKELAKLRGSRLFLVSDIKIPVRSLVSEQKSGTTKAVIKMKNYWLEPKPETEPKFKSPPPTFK